MTSGSEYLLKIRQKLSEIYDYTIGRFISGLFRSPASVLFLGIDNAGKTTLVNKLKNNANNVFMPTKHSTRDVVEIGNLKAEVVDIGGHRAARIAWKDYFFNVDGVVFIVDVCDQERFDEVREAWHAVRELDESIPIVVLMNKIDMLDEKSQTIRANRPLCVDLERATGMSGSAGMPNIEIVYLSIVEESTYNKDSELCKAFAWLSGKIDENFKKNSSK